MSFFSNAARDLKRAISDFLEGYMFEGLSVPRRKFVADATYGLLKSGSPLVSGQARALCEGTKLLYVEKRLCLGYGGFDLSTLASRIAEFSLRELMDFPYKIDVDESDVVKPYGSPSRNSDWCTAEAGRAGRGRRDTALPGSSATAGTARSCKFEFL